MGLDSRKLEFAAPLLEFYVSSFKLPCPKGPRFERLKKRD